MLVWVAPVIVLGVSILVHELGHFLAAKRVGIDVERFSFGFGPKLFGIKRGQTEYCVCLLFFFGGYVKMAGDELGEERKGEVTGREFLSKPPGKRNIVVLAGVTMNFLLALTLYTVVFRIGFLEPTALDGLRIAEVKEGCPWAAAGLRKGDRITAVQGKAVKSRRDLYKTIVVNSRKPLQIEFERGEEQIIALVSPEKDKRGVPIIDDHVAFSKAAVVGQVLPGYPAEAAGLQPRDEILTIDDQSIKNWNEMSQIIHGKAGEEIELLVRRGSEQLKVKVTPTLDQERRVGVIGINSLVLRRYGLLQSFGKSLVQAKEDISLLFDVLRGLIRRTMSPRHVAGPIGIIQISGQLAKLGFLPLISLIAMININLAVINLFPIPVLDGGHLMLFSIEAIRGKPLSDKKQVLIQKIGFALIITLVVLICYNDITRWIQDHFDDITRFIERLLNKSGAAQP